VDFTVGRGFMQLPEHPDTYFDNNIISVKYGYRIDKSWFGYTLKTDSKNLGGHYIAQYYRNKQTPSMLELALAENMGLCIMPFTSRLLEVVPHCDGFFYIFEDGGVRAFYNHPPLTKGAIYEEGTIIGNCINVTSAGNKTPLWYKDADFEDGIPLKDIMPEFPDLVIPNEIVTATTADESSAPGAPVQGDELNPIGHAEVETTGFTVKDVAWQGPLIPFLNVDTIEWQGGITVRYTLESTTDLSTLVPGNDVIINSSGNAVNDGTFTLTAIDPAGDYIEIQNFNRQNADDDEASDSPSVISTLDSNVIRYEFSPVDLSSVVSGNKLVVSGSTNPSNDGTFNIIFVNDVLNYVDVINTGRGSAADDETSVSNGASILQDLTSTFNTPATPIEVLKASGDRVIIGGNSQQEVFSELKVAMDTADGSNTVTFEYYDSDSGDWAAVPTVTDDSAGLTASGNISWDPSDITGWRPNTVPTDDEGRSNRYRIRITGTAPSGSPILDTIELFKPADVVFAEAPHIHFPLIGPAEQQEAFWRRLWSAERTYHDTEFPVWLNDLVAAQTGSSVPGIGTTYSFNPTELYMDQLWSEKIVLIELDTQRLGTHRHKRALEFVRREKPVGSLLVIKESFGEAI
jgi:hypothetical protein